MKRCITRLGWTFGSALLVALAMGCRENRPAENPQATGNTSPTFESNVPQGAQQGQQPPSPEMGQPPTGQNPQTGEAPGPGAGAQNAPGAPGPGGEMGAQQQPAAPPPAAPGAEQQQPGAGAGVNERQLCDMLSNHARLHVEDVHGGVAIVATPKGGQNLSTVRDDAHRIGSAIQQHGTEIGPTGEACGLFSIGRLPDVNTTVNDTGNGVRILMTTRNNNEVRDLRRMAREQIGAMMHGQGQGQGQQHR